jgi:DNA-binding response OmpR family regulator
MPEKRPGSAPTRILLVEDDLDQAHLLKFLLEGEGSYVVTLAQDGLKGSALVRDQKWDLVITDLNLPGADGMAVVEASRKHSPGTPVLATTGYTGPEYADRAREEGADDVLLKPLDRDDLLNRVAALLAGATPQEASRVGPETPTLPTRADPAPSAGERYDPADPTSEPPADFHRVLAISIRPGDAEAGCGGTLLEHRKRGDRVVLLTLTHGTPGDRGERRRDHAKGAGRAMGIRFFVGNAGSGDDPLESDLERLVRGALKEIDPHLLYIPTPHHRNPAFRVVHETAVAQASDEARLFAYDPGDAQPEFNPDTFVPLEGSLEEKMSVIQAFDPADAEHLSAERIVTTSRFWGRHLGGRPAEALARVRGELPSFLTAGSPFSKPPEPH